MPSAPFDAGHVLRGLTLFREAPEPTLMRLAASARRVHLVRGDELFHSGEVSEGLYVVTRGQIKVYARADNGQEKVIEVVMAPACLGESMLGGEAIHSVNATMLTDGVLLLLPREAVMRELRGGPDLAIHLLADVSGRVNRLVHDIEALTLRSASERVVAYLLRDGVVDVPPVPGDAGPCTVLLPASKGTIASLLSVTPEHFSRILHELTELGLIVVEGRKIHIPSVAKLRQHEG